MTYEPAPFTFAGGHVEDLLPDYLAGALDAPTQLVVREHVRACAACEEDLHTWEQIGAVERQRVKEAPVPSLDLLEGIWSRIDVEPAASVAEARPRSGAYLWNVIACQARLLRRSVWASSALSIALATLLAASLSAQAGREGVLTIALPLIAAAGVAFLYGPENDPGLEIALATPTSARFVLLSRFALLFAFDMALALLGTMALSLAHGESLWGFTLAWLGPMTLLSTISLALSLFTGPVVAALGAGLAWLASALRFDAGLALRFPPETLARMTPGILAFSVGALLIAMLAVSRREQFTPLDS